MNIESIEKNFKQKVCEQIRLESEGVNRFRVFTPFLFDDGDHLSIVLKKDQQEWVLTDEGHTFMHLSYDIDEKDLYKGTRQKLISDALSVFDAQDRNGEIVTRIKDESYGDSLYSYIQALIKITDVTYLKREMVHSTFMEDFRQFIEQCVPEDHREFDWHDNRHDPEGNYIVDCRINNRDIPYHIHAVQNDGKAKDTTISILNFEKWKLQFTSITIFEDQEQISRKVLARLTDVCGQQFSSLSSSKKRIGRYIEIWRDL